MLDKTIDGALANLRRDLIRSGGDGLEHVEALMRLRGVAMLRVLPAKRADVARKGEMTRLVLDILRDGPLPLAAIVGRVAEARGLTREQAYERTAQAMHKLRARGLVGREGRVWGLELRKVMQSA